MNSLAKQFPVFRGTCHESEGLSVFPLNLDGSQNFRRAPFCDPRAPALARRTRIPGAPLPAPLSKIFPSDTDRGSVSRSALPLLRLLRLTGPRSVRVAGSGAQGAKSCFRAFSPRGFAPANFLSAFPLGGCYKRNGHE